MLRFTWIDTACFCFTCGFSILIGIYYGCFGNKQSTTKDFLYGGKNMQYIPLALSMATSTLSGIGLLAVPTDVYMFGTQYWITIVGLMLMGIISNYIYLPVFYKLQLNSTYEYLELRFHKSVRKFASFVFSISCILALPVIIYAPSLALEQVTGLSIYITAPLVTGICIFYTAIGGLKSVVWTDAFQYTITCVTLVFIMIMGTISVGGFSPIWDKAEKGDRIEFFNMNPDPTLRSTFWSIAIGHTFVWINLSSVHPGAVQRFLATPSLKDAKKALGLFVLISIVAKSANCFSGLIMYAKYFDCDPLRSGKIQRADQILPYYVLDVAGQIPGISGLFIAGIVSSSLSTLSTFLNSLAGMVYLDFISEFLTSTLSEKKASSIIKLTTFVMGIICLCLVYVVAQIGTMIEIGLTLQGITAGALIGLFTLGMLFPSANYKGALGGGIVSLVFMTWLIVKAKLHTQCGSIKYIPKVLGTTGCNMNETIIMKPPVLSVCSGEEPFWLFKVTFHYYTFMGAFVTIVAGLLISYATRKTLNTTKVDLFSPCVHRFLPLKNNNRAVKLGCVETELNRLDTQNNER